METFAPINASAKDIFSFCAVIENQVGMYKKDMHANVMTSSVLDSIHSSYKFNISKNSDSYPLCLEKQPLSWPLLL